MNSAQDSRKVLITGCSSGIGLAIATGLHKRGYQVYASVRKKQDVEKIRQLGLNCVQLDLADANSIQQAVYWVLEQTDNQLYALINNGAYGQPGAVEDLSTDILRRQFETNLFGTHELTRLLIPTLRQQPRSHIIQISSMLGFICLPYRGAYNASKYALEALTDTMRLELASSGVYISLIEPGPVVSHFRKNAYRAFTSAINPENSIQKVAYQKEIKRFQSDKPVPFTLPADAVLEKVIHALESRKPRIRYPVTKPAHVFKFLKRILPDRWMDAILIYASGHKKKL
ncbi:putative oxidoreductase [bacterium BMS3Bbin11]|nr:putative oxidoreductase [bacterium BMS3Abin11]GBE46437.1 putative oxidoreductase [bacterium BMS3Bbin11]GMT39361.1 MAG: short-chain dehydrogenase/reductase [bacterium]